MSHPDADRWNQRYAAAGEAWLRRQPRPLLLSHLHRLPRRGVALDAAAGVGLHAAVLAAHGLRVVALDISWVALRLARDQLAARGWPLDAAVVDLSRPWLPPHSFDVILNMRFLERATFPVYRRALRPHGWLIFEAFVRTEGDRTYPDHYLYPGELAGHFADFDVLFSHQLAQPRTGGQPDRVVAQLVARKPAA